MLAVQAGAMQLLDSTAMYPANATPGPGASPPPSYPPAYTAPAVARTPDFSVPAEVPFGYAPGDRFLPMPADQPPGPTPPPMAFGDPRNAVPAVAAVNPSAPNALTPRVLDAIPQPTIPPTPPPVPKSAGDVTAPPPKASVTMLPGSSPTMAAAADATSSAKWWALGVALSVVLALIAVVRHKRG